MYCAACGKVLVRPKQYGRIPHYCLLSGVCRQKAYRRRLKAKRTAKLKRDRLVHLSQQSFEWYTPKKYVEAARRVMGEIDLDPASSEQANRIIRAKQFYDQTSDGLTQTWKARTIWLNPPYCKAGNTSNQDRWTAKLLAEYKAGHINEAIVLVTAAVETTWFHRLYQYSLCFVKGRIAFTTPLGRRGSATKGSIFVYLGKRKEIFYQVFRRFGAVK